MRVLRSSRQIGAATLSVAILLAACSGGGDTTTVKANTTGDAQKQANDPAASIAHLSELVAQTPYLQSADLSPPATAADWSAEAIGLVQGKFVGIERAPQQLRTLGAANGSFSATVAETRVYFRLALTSVSAGLGDTLKGSESVLVPVTVFMGPTNEPEEDLDKWVAPFLNAPIPAGITALVPVKGVANGVVDPSHILPLVLSTPDDGTATLLGTKGSNAWGMTSLEAITTATGH
jgi:hypothetical protein